MVKSDKLRLNLWCIVYFLGLNAPGLCLTCGLVSPERLEPGVYSGTSILFIAPWYLIFLSVPNSQKLMVVFY